MCLSCFSNAHGEATLKESIEERSWVIHSHLAANYAEAVKRLSRTACALKEQVKRPVSSNDELLDACQVCRNADLHREPALSVMVTADDAPQSWKVPAVPHAMHERICQPPKASVLLVINIPVIPIASDNLQSRQARQRDKAIKEVQLLSSQEDLMRLCQSRQQLALVQRSTTQPQFQPVEPEPALCRLQDAAHKYFAHNQLA